MLDAKRKYFTFFSLVVRFSFCQYPFIISIAAKKVIIQRDSEQQMISIARVSHLVVNVCVSSIGIL